VLASRSWFARSLPGTTMCRWMAYLGGPINVGSTMFREDRNTIVHQSIEASQGAEPVNGDGFGIGWFLPGNPEPARYRSTEPAWNDENLREITRTLESGAFITHVRAAIGSPVQQSNCHPFRYKDILFVHNGFIKDFHRIKLDVVLAIDRDLYPQIVGSTDSEHMFFLALSFGLQDDPHAALERMVGFIEHAAAAAGIEDTMQMTVGVLRSDAFVAARYASRSLPRTLYHSNNIETLKHMYPEFEELQLLPGDAHAVMSEPLGTLPGAWSEVPISTAVHLRRGSIDVLPFTPRGP
jgi:predicted glutamine amidotransferase